MTPYQEEIYAVKPGSVVLMCGRVAIGLIIGVYSDEYHIMWTYADCEFGFTITQNPEGWIDEVIAHAKLS